LVNSLKVTEKLSKVYSDVCFGGIKWSHDETKIAFVGEVPEIANFKNPFEEEKKAQEAEKKAEEEKKSESEEHW
jgi:hypothetical protein